MLGRHYLQKGPSWQACMTPVWCRARTAQRSADEAQRFLGRGLNAVTLPTITAPVVICVGACCIRAVCSATEVFATGACPNARGAIIAQARTIIIRLMYFPFIELTFRSCL